ncbi:hypothetical protein [Nitrosospira sp. NpAV]|uniref:hypothetical protein n=1 Tax=Nitrosospira sp. NpAV TaxID=58133 RepID=UPI0005A089D5|nr:hypothetical protein [Nitrosospira sp. NpAV]KIO49623.1 hypothetical protein SQ11_05760 [Nitrosospira sp. NpAV]
MAWISEQLLTAIGKHALNECITDARLLALTGLNDKQVENSALKLRKHELIELTGPGCYRLTDAGREALAAGKANLRSGPKGGSRTNTRICKDTLRIRVWRAIRILRKFSIPDLELLVAQGGEKDIGSNIGKYVRALERAGYLIRLQKREAGTALTSNGFIRWWLPDDKDTGLHAPVLSVAKGALYDRNTEERRPLCG